MQPQSQLIWQREFQHGRGLQLRLAFWALFVAIALVLP